MIVPTLISWAIQGDFDYTMTRIMRDCWAERASEVSFYNPPPSFVGGETHEVTCKWEDGTSAHILIKSFNDSSFVWADHKNNRTEHILSEINP